MIYILEITNLLNIAYAIVYAVINNPALHWYQRAWPFLIVWYLQYYVISYYNQAMKSFGTSLHYLFSIKISFNLANLDVQAPSSLLLVTPSLQICWVSLLSSLFYSHCLYISYPSQLKHPHMDDASSHSLRVTCHPVLHSITSRIETQRILSINYHASCTF